MEIWLRYYSGTVFFFDGVHLVFSPELLISCTRETHLLKEASFYGSPQGYLPGGNSLPLSRMWSRTLSLFPQVLWPRGAFCANTFLFCTALIATVSCEQELPGSLSPLTVTFRIPFFPWSFGGRTSDSFGAMLGKVFLLYGHPQVQ